MKTDKENEEKPETVNGVCFKTVYSLALNLACICGLTVHVGHKGCHVTRG